MIDAHELCKKIMEQLGPMETEREHTINDIICSMCLAESLPQKHFHWFEREEDMARHIWDGSVTTLGYYETDKAIKEEAQMIVSDQSHFFSQDTINSGYQLWAHFADGTVKRVYRGLSLGDGRVINPYQNLEKMLLNGELR